MKEWVLRSPLDRSRAQLHVLRDRARIMRWKRVFPPVGAVMERRYWKRLGHRATTILGDDLTKHGVFSAYRVVNVRVNIRTKETTAEVRVTLPPRNLNDAAIQEQLPEVV